MDSSIFFLLSRYYEAGTEGIEWNYMYLKILADEDYLKTLHLNPNTINHNDLFGLAYIKRLSVPGEVNAITLRGINVYEEELIQIQNKIREEAKQEELTQSIIDTNRSIIEINKIVEYNSSQQNKISKTALKISMLALLITALIFGESGYRDYREINPYPKMQDTLQRQELNLLQTIQSHIAENDSSLK
jgi:hypothetical protein